MKSLLLLVGLFSLTPRPPEAVNSVATSLSIENVRTSGGSLWIGIYESEEDFLDRDRARLVFQKVTASGRQAVFIDKLVPGKTYAIGIFHDENDNGELDTNLIGLPAEPWAFSRPLQSWLRKPHFKEMSFVFDPAVGLPTLRLR